MIPISLLDWLFNACLYMTQEGFIITFLCIGFLGIQKRIFTEALFLLLFSMVLNAFLKSLWQIPLPPHLGQGYAFPSGHMQNSTVLWGWLTLKFNNKFFSIFVTLLLFAIGFALIHFNFHSSKDIVGALIAGLLLLIWYFFFLKRNWTQRNLSTIGFILTLLTLPMIINMANLPASILTAEGGLFGFSIGLLFNKADESHFNFLEKIGLTLLALLGVVIIQYLFKYISSGTHSSMIFLRFFFISLWVSCGTLYLFSKLNKIRNQSGKI